MWRVGVLIILSIVFASEAASEYQYGKQLQRIKRSPHYDCPPYYPPPPPPPPPPPFWPPPPPYHHRHHFGPPPYWPPPPPPPPEEPPQPQQAVSQAESSAKSAALTQQSNLNQIQGGGNPPCDTCGGNQNSAVSNSQSDSGTAISIAISSGKNGGK
ncbi:mulatexin-like [Ostrinia furnacalis]|uniref:mulatexin-like n=1 Tax=Ostrinia furnacalis TaxID=93504 RepID=UPI001040CC27|nr:mulatexin-like [Ostrinia furnacalis]